MTATWTGGRKNKPGKALADATSIDRLMFIRAISSAAARMASPSLKYDFGDKTAASLPHCTSHRKRPSWLVHGCTTIENLRGVEAAIKTQRTAIARSSPSSQWLRQFPWRGFRLVDGVQFGSADDLVDC
jgi:hypothetical protein